MQNIIATLTIENNSWQFLDINIQPIETLEQPRPIKTKVIFDFLE